MPLLVHGVLRADGAAEMTAALAEQAGGGVEVVEDGDLAALVSETPDAEALPSRANLLAHARLLETAAGAVTVAPARFGVVVPDAGELRTSLREQRDRLLGLLDRIAGHLELRLRGRYVEDEVVREVVAGDRRAAALRGRDGFDARMELGERVVAGIEARREVDRDRVVAALEGHVADLAVGEVAEPLDAFAVSLLVATERLDDVDDRIEALGEQLLPVLQLELVGPMPPFSFADAGGG